ncbi:MAG: PAS domain-containing protein [Treponema sp.]|nr:PAS domain-containing protein [Treponema sp.]
MGKKPSPPAGRTTTHAGEQVRDPPARLDYEKIVHDMAAGFALHEMIFDEAGRPVDYRFLDANPAYEKITGLKLADILGKRVREVVPGVEERWIEAYGRVVLTGEPILFTDRAEALRKDFEVWAYRPEPGRFVVMVQDVSERTAEERMLADERGRLDKALDATQAGFWEWAIDRGTMRFDGRWIEIAGQDFSPEEEIPLENWRELCHPEDKLRSNEELNRHLSGQIPRYDVEIRIRHGDGRWMWIRDRGQVSERDPDGRPLRMIGTSVDITQRVEESRLTLRQAGMFRAVLASVDSAVAFKGLNGRYLGCNPEYERVFGMTEAEFIGLSDTDLYSPEEAAQKRAEDREIVARGRPMEPDRIWRRDSAGRERLFERRKLPLFAESGSAFGIAVFFHDISDVVLARKADAILIALSQGKDDVTSRGILSTALDELESATGSELGFFTVFDSAGTGTAIQAWSTRAAGGGCGLPPREGHHPMGESALWAELIASRRPLVLGEEAGRGAWNLPAGHAPIRNALLLPVLRGDGVAGVLGIANKDRPYNDWDLKLCGRVADPIWEAYERRLAEERARESALERDMAMSAMRAGVETWDLKENQKRYDERWAAIVGYRVEELPGYPDSTWEALCHPDDLERFRQSMGYFLSGRASYHEVEVRLRHREGRWIWVLERAQVVRRSPSGEPLQVSGLIIDISGMKETEERLRRSLGEKDILLRELFHRTKNTMQLINAMLELKKEEVDSPDFSQAMDAVQNKIIAMSLVQEKLYQTGDLSVLDLGEYITELTALIQDSSPLVSDTIKISSKTAKVPVSIDAAIPCGLIVTELISNSLVHAFPFGARGRIDVTVSKSEDDITIAVRDDGVGLPAGYEVRSQARLGLRTVIGIGEEQLRGRMEFGGGSRGFSCRLTFKDVYYARRL